MGIAGTTNKRAGGERICGWFRSAYAYGQWERPQLWWVGDREDIKKKSDDGKTANGEVRTRRSDSICQTIGLICQSYVPWRNSRSAFIGETLRRTWVYIPLDRRSKTTSWRRKKTRACLRRTGTVVPRAERRSQSSQWRKWIAKQSSICRGTRLRNTTQWMQSYPYKTKTFQETQKSLMKFLEPTKQLEVIYTDNYLEFGKSCEELSCGIIARLHHTDRKQMGLHKEQCAEWKKGHLRCCRSLVWITTGGRILWKVRAISEIFRIFYLMGKHHHWKTVGNALQRTSNTVWSNGRIPPYFWSKTLSCQRLGQPFKGYSRAMQSQFRRESHADTALETGRQLEKTQCNAKPLEEGCSRPIQRESRDFGTRVSSRTSFTEALNDRPSRKLHIPPSRWTLNPDCTNCDDHGTESLESFISYWSGEMTRKVHAVAMEVQNNKYFTGRIVGKTD